MTHTPKAKKVGEAKAELEKVAKQWLRRPGVTAVDVGFKIENNKLTEDVALRVHVERKRPPEELHESEVFNVSGAKNRTEQGHFPVDVIEASYGIGAGSTINVNPLGAEGLEPTVLESADAAEAVNRRSRVRPLIGGISCGNPRATAGTLGAIVFNRKTCKPMILSNWHVLAAHPSASIGEPITQPGRVDGGTTSRDRVASLSAMVLDSRMDAAVAALNSNVSHDREVLGLGIIAGTATPTLGMKVKKSGRSTGITEGIIDGVSLTTTINYGSTVQRFTNQIRIVPRPPWPSVDYEVSTGGDSGSVWMTETRRAVGLHFAGETSSAPSAENAIASPIEPIMSEFNISFAPVVCRQNPTWDLCTRYPLLCQIRLPWSLVFPWLSAMGQAAGTTPWSPEPASLAHAAGEPASLAHTAGEPASLAHAAGEPASLAHSSGRSGSFGQASGGCCCCSGCGCGSGCGCRSGCGCESDASGQALGPTITLGQLMEMMNE